MIWQGILEYARIAGDIGYKEANKATNYENILGNMIRYGKQNEIIYKRDNTRTMRWNTKGPNMGLVRHV